MLEQLIDSVDIVLKKTGVHSLNELLIDSVLDNHKDFIVKNIEEYKSEDGLDITKLTKKLKVYYAEQVNNRKYRVVRDGDIRKFCTDVIENAIVHLPRKLSYVSGVLADRNKNCTIIYKYEILDLLERELFNKETLLEENLKYKYYNYYGTIIAQEVNEDVYSNKTISTNPYK